MHCSAGQCLEQSQSPDCENHWSQLVFCLLLANVILSAGDLFFIVDIIDCSKKNYFKFVIFFYNTPHSATSNFVEPYIIECGSKLPISSGRSCLQADSQISVDGASSKTKVEQMFFLPVRWGTLVCRKFSKFLNFLYCRSPSLKKLE